MPNYKLSPKILEHMIAVGNKLCERRVSHMQTGFPISRDKIQQAVLPVRWRKLVLEMAAEGVAALNAAPGIFGVVNAHAERAAYLSFRVGHSRAFLYCYTHTAYGDNEFITGSDKCLLDTAVFTLDEIAALTKWTNTAVQERRLANLAQRTITIFLTTEAFSRTSGHVLARWPALTTLVDPKVGYSEHEQNTLAGWRTKFREPVRNLKPYAWPPGDPWLAKNEKAMRLTETILNSAQMLPEKIDDPNEVKASVFCWRPLPGDLD